MSEPENLTLQLLRGIRDDMAKMESRLDGKMDNLAADLRSEMRSLRADVASDLMTMEKRLNEQFVGLRRAVMEYLSSAVGMVFFSANSKSACALSSSVWKSPVRNPIKALVAT